MKSSLSANVTIPGAIADTSVFTLLLLLPPEESVGDLDRSGDVCLLLIAFSLIAGIAVLKADD